jgi:TPP-dependent pyruvate/acetoin dehydrogenase alpha subunit
MAARSQPRTLHQRLALYRHQVEIRAVEKRAYDLFLRNLVRGTTHLAIGQEAIAAGFALAMRPDDYTFTTYRGHHHAIARGVSFAGLLGELVGRGNGLMRGRGGSMHIASVAHGMYGSYAIVGAHLPIAAGAAWSAQYRRSGQVAVCFFGDGATNIGSFHETLNLAAVWRLPVIYVCENNLYMEYTATRKVTAVEQPAADRAASYGLERLVIDGNDPETVYETACRLIDRARNGGGPSLVEALTYRHGGHSRADPGKYRPAEEVEAWLAKDPVPAYRHRLVALGIDETELERIDQEVADAVEQATAEVAAAPEPSLDEIERDLWADGGVSWRR